MNKLIEDYLDVIQDDSYINELSVIGSRLSISAFGIIPWAILRAISASYDKASRKCGIFKISNDRDACINKARIERSEKRIKELKDNKDKCNDKLKPDKCKKKVDDRVKYEKDIIKKSEKILAKLKKQGRA